MGRAYEVRKASMAATGAKKSALYMRASKEIYMAAKSGVPDPNANLNLRSVIEKYKGQSIPKDVVERAIKKAAGGEQETFIAGRFEGMGPGNTFIIVDSLTSNVNRAASEIRSTFTKKGGHLGAMGSVAYLFDEVGELVFNGPDIDAVTEQLVMDDVDVIEVKADEDAIDVLVAPTAFSKARDSLASMGINDFLMAEITMLPQSKVTLVGEDLEKFNHLIDSLEELEDVQNIYHNCDN